MNQLFHYHITGFVAQLAGFSKDDAQLLAWSSTMPDHALVPFILVDAHGKEHALTCTHHYGMASDEHSRDILVPFHFVPAGGNDGMIVRPKGAIVKAILVEALRTRNLYRMGIALHAYADSWAHQGFSGRRGEENRLSSSLPVPPIGHAQGSRLPDLPGISWIDPRSPEVIIDNDARFLEAAEYQYRYLCTYHGRSFADWPIQRQALETCLGAFRSWESAPAVLDGLSAVQGGINSVKDWLSRHKVIDAHDESPLQARRTGMEQDDLGRMLAMLSDFAPFDGTAWYREICTGESWEQAALVHRGIGAKLASAGQTLLSRHPDVLNLRLQALDTWENSHLWRWNQAALEHRDSARRILADQAPDLA